MPKLTRLPARKVVQKLQKAGFRETHQRGSHLYLKSSDGTKIVTIPVHGPKDIPIGTLYTIVVRQAGSSIDEFNNLRTYAFGALLRCRRRSPAHRIRNTPRGLSPRRLALHPNA